MTSPHLTSVNPVDAQSSTTAAVARAIVRVYKEQFGRGPTKVKVSWADPDTLVCVLDDTLTPAERKLVTLGNHSAVRAMRILLQHATVDEFCTPVEELTGRRVRAFHSSIDTLAEGQALELFVLHPVDYDGETRSDLSERIDETQ